MVRRCATTYLTNGGHTVYVTGFQGWGGVGQELTYSGADTAGKDLFVRAGFLPPVASSFRGIASQSLAFRWHRQRMNSGSVQVWPSIWL